MKKIFKTLFILSVVFGCSENKSDEIKLTNKKDNENQSFESIVNRHVQSQLSIPATEKFKIQIYKEHMDGDNKIDAIISVNRLDFAKEEAQKAGRFAIMDEMGLQGSYNYIFYFDGGLNQISPPINIPSAAKSELNIHFENISTAAFKDVLVDFKIKNSSFRNYYIISNHTPSQVFQWKLYDYLGEKNVEANFIEYSNGSVGLAKDILIYKGKLKNGANVKDIYNFLPEIEKDGELSYRFFYLDKEGKYFTKKK